MLGKTLTIAFVALMLQVSTVKANECVTAERFAAGLSKEGIALRGSTAAATEKLAALFNQNRAARGQPAAEISIFLFGLVTLKSGETGVLVTIVDKSGCIVRGSIAVLSLQVWSEFAMIAGVGPEDFVPLEGA